MRGIATSRQRILATATAVAAGAGAIGLAVTGGGRPVDARVAWSAQHERVALLPDHSRAGAGGWCLATVGGRGHGYEDCYAVTGPYRAPIVAESGFGLVTNNISRSERRVLVTSRVAEVSLSSHPRVATHPSALLPDGLRGAIISVSGKAGEPLPSLPHGPVAAWSRSGRQIASVLQKAAPLAFSEPSREWSRGHGAPRGVCSIRVRGLGAAAFQAGSVMNVVRPHDDVRGKEFIDCARSSYLLGKWPVALEANVVLSAAHPGTRPAPLPAMRPFDGHPGIVIGPGGIHGDVIARRTPHAWLLVAEGEDMRQRLTLLKHLHVVIHA